MSENDVSAEWIHEKVSIFGANRAVTRVDGILGEGVFQSDFELDGSAMTRCFVRGSFVGVFYYHDPIISWTESA